MTINPDQTAADLFDLLSRAGAPLMVETLAGLANGAIQPKPQDQALATLAPLLVREDGRMDFTARTAVELKDRWRGFQPWPGAFTQLDGKKLIVHRMEVSVFSGTPAPAADEPGGIHVENRRLLVRCARETWLELIELQLEGKKRLTAIEFLRGAPLPVGARLG